MINKISHFLIFIIFLFSTELIAQKNTISCEQISTLTSLLEKYQYSPITIDASVSDSIKTQLYRTLDPNRLLFTKWDINYLNSYSVNFADPTDDNACKYFDTLVAIYKAKLKHADSLITQLGSMPMNHTEKDSLLIVNKDSKWFAENDLQLNIRWQKWLKYQVLNSIFQPVDDVGNPINDSLNILLGREEDIRLKVGKKEKLKISRILDNPQGFESYVAAELLNTIAKQYDAHTEFFSPVEKQQFENSVSTSAYLFGFSFIENENGLIVIQHIIPGSAAWKSNKLHKGDQLFKIKFTGAKVLDVSTADFNEVMSVLSSGTDEAEFSVKKQNGKLITVKLKKEKTENDEALIKSYILKGKQSIGYISLPDFYTDISSKTAKGCSNDMAKEILKLQKENIGGLIIDLRYNGGGSMEEAVDLAGIFINEGPLCVLKNKAGVVYSIKDMNRGTIYNGPLLVLINGLSASASELFAGVLQDYNRAIIVGSPSFGKASAQVIYPMDPAFDPVSTANYKATENKGFLKITIEKFYRITGKSHQQKGIIPDVYLPPFFYELGYKESELSCALSLDSVSKKIVYQPLPPLPVKELALKSSERISSDHDFKNIKHLGDSLKKIININNYLPLEIHDFRNKKIMQNTFYEKMDSLTQRSATDFEVINNYYDKEIMKMDSYLFEINSVYLKNIQMDIYIEESYRIMNDMINSNLK